METQSRLPYLLLFAHELASSKETGLHGQVCLKNSEDQAVKRKAEDIKTMPNKNKRKMMKNLGALSEERKKISHEDMPNLLQKECSVIFRSY